MMRSGVPASIVERLLIMAKKLKIKKDSVQETLLIPLYSRKLAMDMYPGIFHDMDAQKLFEQIECDFDMQSGLKRKIGAIMGATRQYDMACVCKEYLKEHPKACVVNLGCGLDTTFRQVDNGMARGVNIDFPDTIAVREELLSTREREINIPSNLMDFSWFDKLDYRQEEGIVFFASGVFYYFKREDVKRLLCALAEYFPGGKIVFDATNASGLKNMAKTWLSWSDMKQVGIYFSVENEQELKDWSLNFKEVVRKGYMTGHRSLDKRFGVIANTVFRSVDKMKKCQMIEITFG